MSTREEMRRELKDLARMATRMTGERAISSLPSHADRRMASAVIEPSAAPPPTASVPSVLPAPVARSVAIQTPPAMTLPVAALSRGDASPEALQEEERSERRGGLLAVLAGLGLAVAMVGGLAAGRWLAEGATSTSSGDAPLAHLAAAGPPAEIPLPPASIVAVVDPSSIAPASPAPMAPVVIASTRVASFAAPPRRPIPHFGPAKPVASSGVESRAPAAHESLEELMRRSVATQAQSGKR